MYINIDLYVSGSNSKNELGGGGGGVMASASEPKIFF